MVTSSNSSELFLLNEHVLKVIINYYELLKVNSVRSLMRCPISLNTFTQLTMFGSQKFILRLYK